MVNPTKINNRQELLKYAKLCNDEFGEACQLLVSLAGYSDYINDDFRRALDEEILRKLKYFMKNCEIVETHVINEYDITELEWKC